MLSNPNPIFPDRTMRPTDYPSENRLLVTKVFGTIQGEGPYAGWPAVFVRLAGCNLGGKGVNGPGCTFCDTDFRVDRATWYSHDELRGVVARSEPARPHTHGKHLIVVTGGEPLLQPSLAKFIQYCGSFWDFQIETNGTVRPALPTWVNVVVSPKVVESPTQPHPTYSKPHPHMMQRADFFKFVVSADPNSPYYDVPAWADDVRQPVYVSPMAVYHPHVSSPTAGPAPSIWDAGTFDQRACAANHARAAQLAMQRGFIMAVQMHLFCAVE